MNKITLDYSYMPAWAASRAISQFESAVNLRLFQENYKRSQRRLNYADVIQVLRECISDNNFGEVNGGTVANAYNYPATTVACVGWRTRNKIILRIGCRRANSNASPVTWAGITSVRDAHVQTFVESEKLRETDIQIPTKLARLIIANAGIAKLSEFPNWETKSVEVIREDSLAAGNCQASTDSLISLLGSPKSMVANELMRRTATVAANLLPYAWRAIQFAINDEKR
jgi:hypothetical protein